MIVIEILGHMLFENIYDDIAKTETCLLFIRQEINDNMEFISVHDRRKQFFQGSYNIQNCCAIVCARH